MTPFEAFCMDCHNDDPNTPPLKADEFDETCELMLEHHNKARIEGSWTKGVCGFFLVKEINTEGEVVKEQWLESTMKVVVRAFEPRPVIVYDGRRTRKKER